MTGAGTFKHGTGRSSGAAFTLIEVIVALVLLALAATMMMTYLGRVMERSSDSAVSLGEAYDLQGVAERIRAAGVTNNLQDLSGMIGAEGSTRDGAFGAYRVIHNRRIRFAGGSEQLDPGGTNLLKVTVASEGGERLTLVLREKTR